MPSSKHVRHAELQYVNTDVGPIRLTIRGCRGNLPGSTGMPPLSKTGSVAAHQHDIRADVYRGLADDLAGAAMDAAAEGTEATMTGPAGQRRMWAVHASCRIYTRTLFPWSVSLGRPSP
ncbi:hypothetical protein N7461_002843 [Penicillium sp. DV-2018c]|nr:hypothetical protein N7461_002843 [Penicillium sp. DV-2018c]